MNKLNLLEKTREILFGVVYFSFPIILINSFLITEDLGPFILSLIFSSITYLILEGMIEIEEEKRGIPSRNNYE